MASPLLLAWNGELSVKRCWRGPRSQEVGEEGDYTHDATLSPPDRAQLCVKSRGGRPVQPVPCSPCGLCGCKVTLILNTLPPPPPPHQNDFCTELGSDEIHFKVSVRDKATSQYPQTTTWERTADEEVSRGPSAWLAGQSGSLNAVDAVPVFPYYTCCPFPNLSLRAQKLREQGSVSELSCPPPPPPTHTHTPAPL